MRSNEVVFGINAVATRLKRGDGLVELLVREGKLSARLEEMVQLARDKSCRVSRRSLEELDRMTALSHQGVALTVAATDMKSESFLNTVLEGVSSGKLLILILDGVTDPRNLGACLRSAATLGVDAVIVPKNNSAPLNEAAIKTASGGAAVVPLVQVTNLSRGIEKLKKHNVWIVGTLLDAETPIDRVDLSGNIAIVMGSEDKGLRRNTVDHCDLLARIPMVNTELGFNVSVAAGVCLYEAHRQRTARTG
ncbi:MAG TPA: 23S rRNA (guanosine(2251)-2'-O)-methyltransferase RlmB [Pseudomonadales bacterium]|nr:23S rRNA (guanosine(2251)-2'-O)-methyltransferase RlmB [Pseudomonadales bacterium]